MLEKRRLIIYISIAVAAIALVTTAIVLIASGRRRAEEKKQPRVVSIMIDAPADIPLEEKEEIVYKTLVEAGYSPAGACGIMGNIAVESPDFDPAAVNESGGTLGLFQWNDVGDRKQNFKDFCKEQKLNWNSIEAQLAFMIYELSGADPIACRLDDLLKETDDAYTAAAEFTAGFERCITDGGKRTDTYTGSLYPEFYGNRYQALSKRINKAMNYYERFSQGNDHETGEINITIE